MGKQYRIRVYGTARKRLDPALMAQVLIMLGRRLYQQQLRRHNTK